ncbi:hypothetical protein KR222_009811, partial [Zaprionus bogoriensis]
LFAMAALHPSLFLVLYLTVSNVKADCTIELLEPKPQVLAYFGSKHFLSGNQYTITRDESEDLHLFCASGFSDLQTTKKSIDFKCYNNQFYYVNENNEYSIRSPISCAGSIVNSLYESRMAMPNCADMTLVVGQNFGELGSLKSIAICYNFEGQRLKYVSYTAYPSKITMLEKNHVGQLNPLGLDIEVDYSTHLFKQITAFSISEALRKDKQFHAVFGDETFEWGSLVQDEAFHGQLEPYNEMLGIIWLRALRNGNWRNLLNALQIASLNAKYDIRVGVSGAATVPILQTCNETRTLTLDLDAGTVVTVPAYIWAHVRAINPSFNSTDEFVAIGQNSPMNTIARNGFCTSICDQITWLKNSLFAKLQQNPIFGIVQCCHLSDVADKLDNF